MTYFEQRPTAATTHLFAPLFVFGYLLLGFLCVKAPVRVERVISPIPEKDLVLYGKAKFLQRQGSKESIFRAIAIYVKLVKKGYYEILDILISLYYHGVPGIIPKSQDATEILFSLRVKIDRMFSSIGVAYEPKFRDAVSKEDFLKALRLTEIKENAKFTVRSDNQNAHDSGVTGSVRATIEALRKTTLIVTSSEEALEHVRSWVEHDSKLNKKQMIRAGKVLDIIYTNVEILDSVNMKEIDILCLIYNRINAPANAENRDTMISNLTEELADSQYCTVGRISRMLNSLNVLDPQVFIKPKWAIRQEMLQDASVTKQRLLEALPEQISTRLESDTVFSDEFDDRFRRLLRDRYRHMYVETRIMSQSDLDKELDGWIEYV